LTARYFPIKSTPFRFQAGLHPFGTDFGNRAADRLYFQVDEQRALYLAAKRRVSPARHRVLERDEAERLAVGRVLAWMRETLQREHAEIFASPPETLRGVGAAVQEDLVLLHRRGDATDAAIAVDVCFPSDWRPDRIAGTDFRFIHGPVPGFADSEAQARSLVSAMIDRGPYVRFVWTLKADDRLDHHPDRGPYPTWSEAGEGYLRVERQVMVPFPEVSASLFLIRTYLYPFSSLGAEERAAIAGAVDSMPEAAARYKGFAGWRDDIRRLLGV
jgi:hypothetical protein